MILSDADLLAGAPGTGAQLLDLSDDAYHADPCETPSLSSSIAKILLEQSPAHARLAHPRLGGVSREPTAALDRGTLIHKLVLGKGAQVAIITADDFRTKKAREERDAARERGELPVLAHVFDEARDAADAIRASLAAEGVELDGESEVSITWQEQARSGPIWARARLDHLIAERGLIYDLKTARSAHPRACSRSMLDYGYDIQAAAYTRAVSTLRPELAGRVAFEFLFVETEPPYALSIGPVDGVLREHGERRWAKAVETWASCLLANRWPGYGRTYFEAPPWLASRMEDAA